MKINKWMYEWMKTVKSFRVILKGIRHGMIWNGMEWYGIISFGIELKWK